MKDEYGFDIQCEHSKLAVVDETDEDEFLCMKDYVGKRRVCYCNESCKEYEPNRKAVEEIIDDMAEEISKMMMKNPKEWVVRAYMKAYDKALTHHVELDSCGKEVWVKNE